MIGLASGIAAVGYARVSREEQAREGVSLDAQRARIAAYATAKGFELTDVLVDEGLSGKDIERPEPPGSPRTVSPRRGRLRTRLEAE